MRKKASLRGQSSWDFCSDSPSVSAAAILVAERKSCSPVRAAEPLLHFNTALVELSVFQDLDKMELAHTHPWLWVC